MRVVRMGQWHNRCFREVIQYPLQKAAWFPLCTNTYLEMIMTEPANSQWFFRPQFSLRGLFAVLGLAGLGFASKSGCERRPLILPAKARNVGLSIKQLIHDRDTKFAKSFRKTLRSRRIKPLQTAYRAPNLNAFVERFIRSVRSECLYHFVVLGQRHLDYLLSEYRAYYHCLRPHQGRDNLPLSATGKQRRKKRPPDEPDLKLGAVRCQQKLGGLIKHYYREAA